MGRLSEMSFPPSMFLDPTFFVSNMCERLCDESVVQFLLVALSQSGSAFTPPRPYKKGQGVQVQLGLSWEIEDNKYSSDRYLPL